MLYETPEATAFKTDRDFLSPLVCKACIRQTLSVYLFFMPSQFLAILLNLEGHFHHILLHAQLALLTTGTKSFTSKKTNSKPVTAAFTDTQTKHQSNDPFYF